MKKFILSGHHTQSIEFAKSKGWKLNEWVILQSVSQMKGLQGGELYLVGTYKEHKNLDAILLEASLQNFKVINSTAL